MTEKRVFRDNTNKKFFTVFALSVLTFPLFSDILLIETGLILGSV